MDAVVSGLSSGKALNRMLSRSSILVPIAACKGIWTKSPALERYAERRSRETDK